MKEERPWLVTIHCVNHRLELAIKKAVSEIPRFEECDQFYVTMFFLLRNSGKLKTEVKNAAIALGITHYPMPKIHGTRFVNHRRKGLKKLLHNWPVLITAFENYAANPGCRGETHAKAIGIRLKLKSYKFMCDVAVYLDVLDSIGPLSLIF